MIQKGSKGEEVSIWQNFLVSRKYKIAADGDFGPHTDRATRDFQKKNGLGADGIVGPRTYEAKARLTGGKVPEKPVIPAEPKPAPKPAAGEESLPAPAPEPYTAPPALDAYPLLKKVHPRLAAGVLKIIAQAKAEGYTLIVTQGLRTFAEQDKLYLKRPRVTKAKGGQSNHNYGLSVDLAFVTNGKLDWTDSLYLKIGKWSKNAGLAWGGNWKSFRDLPHVELHDLPGWRTLLTLYNQGGIPAVWKKYGGG